MTIGICFHCVSRSDRGKRIFAFLLWKWPLKRIQVYLFVKKMVGFLRVPLHTELIIMNEINSKYDKYNVINSKESVLGKCTFLHVLAERKLIFEHLWNFNHYHSCMCLQEMVLAKMCQNSWKQIIRKEKKVLKPSLTALTTSFTLPKCKMNRS